MDMTLLRVGIAIAGVLLIAAIYFFGRPRKPGQGRRVAAPERGEGGRIEPTLGAQLEDELSRGDARVEQSEFDLDERPAAGSDLGRRGDQSLRRSSPCTSPLAPARCCAARTSWSRRKRPA